MIGNSQADSEGSIPFTRFLTLILRHAPLASLLGTPACGRAEQIGTRGRQRPGVCHSFLVMAAPAPARPLPGGATADGTVR
jgi:hypothetical protein